MLPSSHDGLSALPTGHPRDISAEDLDRALATARRPDLLRQLVDLSRRALGFYTSHYPHTLNYPWIVEWLERVPKGRVLDIGAGVSPVPLLLAERGLFVDCVDSHPVVRTPPTKPDWNEWGFFDYGALHENLTAHQCDIANFTPPARYDAIYSISSLVHMTRDVREEVLRHCGEWLGPQGLLLLAIDVIPASDFLWNRSEGHEVEPPVRHGTVDDVVHQVTGLGFQIEEFQLKRTVYKARTDLLFIACTRPSEIGTAQSKA
jgi:SAM-dependent methyltransferase